MDEITTWFRLEAENDQKYKVKRNWDGAIYIKESKSNLLGLYYLVLCKNYPEEKTT